MKLKIIFLLMFFCGTTNMYAQYAEWAVYVKTPYDGEYSIKRIDKNVDTIINLSVVGGSSRIAIDRSQGDNIDVYGSYKRIYNERNKLISYQRLYPDDNDVVKCDTLMLFTYDEQGRILRREESSFVFRYGLFPDYFLMDKEYTDTLNDYVKTIIEYDYENNTISKNLILKGDTVKSYISYVNKRNLGFNGYRVTTIDLKAGNSVDTTDFIFDNQNRLISTGDVTYKYIANGFIETKNDESVKYVFDSNGDISSINSIQFALVTANEQSPLSQLDALIIYSNNQIRVVCEKTFSVSVYNLQGQLILQRDGCQGNIAIPFGSEASGVYVVNVSDGTGCYSQKIVK